MTSDLAEDFKALKEHNKARKAEQAPSRMLYARQELERAGAGVETVDGMILQVFVPGEKKPREFWPWNGWFNGKGQGRGLGKLVAIVRRANK